MGLQTFECPGPRPSTGSLRLAGPPAPGVEALGADASVLEEALNLLGSGGLAAKPCRQRGPLSRTLAFTAFSPHDRARALLRFCGIANFSMFSSQGRAHGAHGAPQSALYPVLDPACKGNVGQIGRAHV